MNGSPISILINAQLNEAQALSQLRTQVSQLQSRVGSISINANVNSSQINNASGQLNNLASSANNAKKSTQSLFNTMGKVAMWGVVTGSVYGTIRAFKDMVAEIVTVDTKLTELRRVTQNGFDINGVLQDSIKLSSQLGNNLNDVLDTVNGFARAGNYSKQQLMDLTKVATVASNVSDLKPQDAMNDLIATMKAYGIEAQNTMGIVDKMNEVDNNYAISTQQIAESLKKASSTAKTFGVDINHLIADTTAIGQVTQESGSVIGNSLKTIYSRLTTVGSSVNTLKSLGVAIKDSSGDMRSASDILNDLADKWDTLTKAQQEQAAVSIAGRYQLSRFLALMTQHDQETQALTTSINSQGSAMRENAKYLDSMQAKINQMKNAFAELALAMGKAFASSGITSLVLGLTNLATAGVKIVQVFGGLPSIITAAYIAFMLFGGESRKYVTTMAGVNTVTGKFSNIFGELRATLALTKMQIEEETVGMTGLQRGFVSAGAAARTFGILFKEALIGTGIGIAIVAISFAIEKLVGHFSELHQAAVKEQEDMTTSSKNYQENKKEIDGLVESYSKLDKLKNTTGLSNKQQEEYLNIQQQLANVLPSVVAGTDSQGKSIIVSSDALKANIELIKQKIKLDHDSAVDSAPQTQQTSDNNIQSFQSQIKKKEDLVKGLNDQIKQSNLIMNSSTSSDFTKSTAQQSIISSTKQMDKAEQDILDLKTKIVGEQDKQKSSIQDILKIYTSLSGSDVAWLTNLGTKGSLSAKQIDDLGNKLNDLRSSLKQPLPSNFFDKMSATQIQSVISLVQGYKNGSISLVEFEKALTNAGLTAKQVSTLIDDLTNAQKKNASSTKNDSKAMSDFTDSLKDASTYAGLLGKTLSGLKVDSNGSLIDEGQQLNELINTYQILSDMEANGDKLTTAQKQLKKNAIDALNASYPNLIQNGKLNIDAAKKEADANSVLLDAMNKAAAGLLTDEQQMTLAKISATKARIAAIQTEIDGLNTLKTAYNDYVTSVSSAMKNATDQQLIQATHIAMMKNALANSGDTKAYQNQIDQYNKVLDSLYIGLKTSLDSTSSSASKANQTTTSSIYVVDKYTESLNKLNEQQKLLEDAQTRYDQNSQQYRNALSQEIALLKQKESLMNSQVNSLNSQIKSGNIDQYGLISVNSTTSTSSSSSYKPYSGKYSSSINKYANQYGVDPNLVAAVAMQESSMGATSSNVMQVNGMNGMGATASIQKGTQMLADLLNKTGGNIDKALAAYNMGSGILPYFNAHGGYSTANMQAFSNSQKSKHGYSVYGDPNYINNVMRYYPGVVTSSSKSSSTKSSSSDKASQQQAVDQAKQSLLDLNGQIADIKDQIYQLNYQIVQSKLSEFEVSQTKYDNQISILKDKESLLDSTSTTYTKNIEDQNSALEKKQKSIAAEIKYAEQEIKDTNLSAAAHADLKNKVDALNVSYEDLTVSIKQNDDAIAQSKINKAIQPFSDKLTSNNKSLDAVNSQLNIYQYSDSKDIGEEVNLLTKKQSILLSNADQDQKSIAALEKQKELYKGNSTELAYINSQIDQYTSNLQSTNEQLAQNGQQLVSITTNAITDYYNAQIQSEQDKLDLLNKQINAQQQLNQLQDLQNQLTQAMNDKRYSYIDANGKETLTYDKSKVADLQKQISDTQTQMEQQAEQQAIQDQITQLGKDEQDAISTVEKQWANLVQQFLDGKITFKQLMSEFYTDSLGDLKTYTGGVSDQIDELTKAYQQLLSLGASVGSTTVPTKPTTPTSTKPTTTSSKPTTPSKPTTSTPAKSSKPTTSNYTVKSGDTLSELAVKNHTTVSKLQKLNPSIKDPDKIYAGSTIKLPKYHDGGIVAESSNKLTQLANKFLNTRLNPNESVIKALKGELLSPAMNIAQNFIPNMATLFNSFTPSNGMTNVTNNNYSLNNVTIQADNPNQLLQQIQQMSFITSSRRT